MKWRIRSRNLFKWHPWFAWHPVTVSKSQPGAGYTVVSYVWLRTVQRCMFDSWGGAWFEYRDPRNER